VTTLSGNAVRKACESVRGQLFRVAGEKLQVGADELALGGGRVFVKSDPARGISLAETVQSSIFRDRDGQQVMAFVHYDAPCDLPDPETGIGDFAMAYSFGVHAVDVEVDPDTGYTRVLRLVAGTDCGNLINPALAEGQVEGGCAQGIGYALMEDLVCQEGQVLNSRFGSYKIPTVMEMPKVEAIWVETDDPRGPYGAKGLGEMGMVPTAPAIANAVYQAVGVRIQELPITPEKVLDGVEAGRVLSAES
jgi:putative selenate reductase molybdopterin-binding subunit